MLAWVSLTGRRARGGRFSCGEDAALAAVGARLGVLGGLCFRKTEGPACAGPSGAVDGLWRGFLLADSSLGPCGLCSPGGVVRSDFLDSGGYYRSSDLGVEHP